MKQHLIAILLALTVLPVFKAQADLDGILDESWAGVWRPVTEAEFAQAQSMFRLALTNPGSPLLEDIMRTLQFRRSQLADSDVFVLHEDPASRSGRGVFVFRERGYIPIMLQVPHARADRHTGLIARQWMKEIPFQVLALNTVHRRSGADDDTADLARQALSYFMALQVAYSYQWAEPRAYQLHGFDAEKRNSTTGRLSDFILSSGRQDVAPPVLSLAGCLKPASEGLVSIYPIDVDELGGTVNPVSRWYRDRRLPGYVHIEMSLPVREKLLAEDSYRRVVGQCLTRD